MAARSLAIVAPLLLVAAAGCGKKEEPPAKKSGALDCDKNPSNGAEVDPRSDPDHCGGCGQKCGSANASSVSCVSGECVPHCRAGFAVCGRPGVEGCGVDVSRSPQHCGACDVGCQGAYCRSGHCGGPIAAFAKDVFAYGLTMHDERALYLIGRATNGYDIARIPFVEEPKNKAVAWATKRSFFAETHDEKWAFGCDAQADDSCRLVRAPLRGGPTKSLATIFKYVIYSLSVDGPHLYFSTREGEGRGKIQRMPIDGGEVTTLADAQNAPGGIAVSGSAVFWVDEGSRAKENKDGAVKRISREGGFPVVLTAAESPSHLALSGKWLYYATSASGGAVMRIPVASQPGGRAELIAEGQSAIRGLAVSATHVYWGVQGKDVGYTTVRRIAKPRDEGS